MSTPCLEASDARLQVVMFQVVMGLLSGLVLFLFGINQLSATLVRQLEEKAKSWLSRFTHNTLTAMAPWFR